MARVRSPPAVLDTISVSKDSAAGLHEPGRPRVRWEDVLEEYMEGSPLPDDVGVESEVMQTATMFRRATPAVGVDLSTVAQVQALAVPPPLLSRCLSGVGRGRRERMMLTFGPTLAEVVRTRKDLEEGRLMRVGTVRFANMPAWVRWCMHHHSRMPHGMCNECRHVLHPVVLAWFAW